jgi:hypothetical protein
MNDGATARVPQSESHLRILPLERACGLGRSGGLAS